MELKKKIEKAPDEIKRAFIYRNYKKGAMVISPTQTIEHLYIQIEGKTEVYNQNMAGNFFHYSVDEGYTCFGEVELFIDGLKPLSILAKTDCRVILLKKEYVMKWMKLDFDFNLLLFKYMAMKLNQNSDKMAQIAFMTVKDRVLYSIYTHYKIGDLDELTKERISNEASAPLRSVNRAIEKLRDEGFVLYRKKRFSLCDVEEIAVYLEGVLE